jgi:hypothetical protein
MRILAAFLFFACSIFNGMISLSQLPEQQIELDAISSRFYQQHRWDDLIQFYKVCKSKSKLTDELIAKAGIAYYNTGNYRHACSLFSKLSGENEIADSLSLYMKSAFEFSGQHFESKMLSLNNHLSTSSFSFLKPNIDGLNIEAGNCWNLESSEPKFNINTHIDSSFWVEYRQKNLNYYSAGITTFFRRIGSFSIAYSAISLGIKVGFADFKGNKWVFNEQLRQQQFYFSGLIIPLKALKVQLAANYWTIDGNSWKDTAATGKPPSFQNLKYSSSENLLFLGIDKEWNWGTSGLSFTYLELLTGKFLQPGCKLVWYPFGNLNLYFIHQSWFVFYPDSFSLTGKPASNRKFISAQTCGLKLFPFLWIEGIAYYGKISCFAENGGFLVYNNQEDILKRFDLNLFSPILKGKAIISLRMKYLEKQVNSYHYSYSGNLTQAMEPFDTLSIISGISFHF